MVFYAFASYTPGNNAWRGLIVAPDADTIDEWWREVSEKSTAWTRIRPDYYEWNAGDLRVETSLSNRLIFSHLPQIRTFGSFPGFDYHGSVERADHRSGRSFYIRAKHDRTTYWYAKTDGDEAIVYASQIGRTRFQFKIEGGSDGTVIINKDKVTISPTSNSKLKVGIESGQVVINKAGGGITFGDLRRGFLADGLIDVYGNHSPKLVQVDEQSGEDWELVE